MWKLDLAALEWENENYEATRDVIILSISISSSCSDFRVFFLCQAIRLINFEAATGSVILHYCQLSFSSCYIVFIWIVPSYSFLIKSKEEEYLFLCIHHINTFYCILKSCDRQFYGLTPTKSIKIKTAALNQGNHMWPLRCDTVTNDAFSRQKNTRSRTPSIPLR